VLFVIHEFQVSWQYDDNGSFKPYPPDINAVIEKAKMFGNRNVTWNEIDGETYIIDFTRMIETNSSDPSVEVTVRRVTGKFLFGIVQLCKCCFAYVTLFMFNGVSKLFCCKRASFLGLELASYPMSSHFLTSIESHKATPWINMLSTRILSFLQLLWTRVCRR